MPDLKFNSWKLSSVAILIAMFIISSCKWWLSKFTKHEKMSMVFYNFWTSWYSPIDIDESQFMKKKNISFSTNPNHCQSSYILRRPQNLVKYLPYFWLALHRTKVRWRFHKILRPSQNIWTLITTGLVLEFEM